MSFPRRTTSPRLSRSQGLLKKESASCPTSALAMIRAGGVTSSLS